MKKLICFLILLAGVGISFAQEIKVKTAIQLQSAFRKFN